jgi:hypothetical protein
VTEAAREWGVAAPGGYEYLSRILFPDSNHGSHFQFTQSFNRYLSDFLDR